MKLAEILEDYRKNTSPEKFDNLERYFDSLKLPENQHIKRESLGLTEEDTRMYQLLKEQEISMKPAKKRDIVIKEVVKPLLKEAGYQCKRNEWWRELEDGWLFIHLKNSSFNSVGTGCSFEFDISVSGKDEIEGKLEEQWIYNQLACINHMYFLPYCGYLSPNVDVLGYRIDGYRCYLPQDIPVEEIKAQIEGDFRDYILPALGKVCSMEDWEKLYQERKAESDRKEIRILRFYSSMHSMCCSKENLPHAVEMKKNLKLTEEDILSHLDWYEKIREFSAFPFMDAGDFMRMVFE